MDNGNKEFDLDSHNLNSEEWNYTPNHDPRSMGNTAISSPENQAPSQETVQSQASVDFHLPPGYGPTDINNDTPVPSSNKNPDHSTEKENIVQLENAIRTHHGEIDAHTASTIESTINEINDPSEIIAMRDVLSAIANGEGRN